jgi:hypothetical protein
MTTHDSDNASGGFVSFERVLRDDSEVPSYWPFSARWFRDNAAARIRELEQQVARDAKDAARYRYLRSRIPVQFDGEWLTPASEVDGELANEALDAAIDSELALSAQPSTPAEDEKV